MLKRSIVLSFIVLLMATSLAEAEDALVVSAWGGNWKDSLEKVVGKAFTAKTGIPVEFEAGGTIDRLATPSRARTAATAHAAAGRPPPAAVTASAAARVSGTARPGTTTHGGAPGRPALAPRLATATRSQPPARGHGRTAARPRRVDRTGSYLMVTWRPGRRGL